MDKLTSKLAETSQHLKRFQTAYRELCANQSDLERMLRFGRDNKNQMLVKRNMRLLQAINGAMSRFVLLSVSTGEEETRGKTNADSVLIKDMLEVAGIKSKHRSKSRSQASAQSGDSEMEIELNG